MASGDPTIHNVEDLIGWDAPVPVPETVKVRWISYAWGKVGSRRHYKDDQFEIPRSLVDLYGKNIEIL